MSTEPTPFRIGYPLYAGVDMLDVVGSAEVFAWSSDPRTGRSTEVLFVGPTLDPVVTITGKRLLPDATFTDCPQLDVLYVPGGGHVGIGNAMQDPALIGFLQRQAEKAQVVAAVCSGALLLAAAKLLDGHEATTHWQFRSSLALFPRVQVAAHYPRWVWSGDRCITGGGISSTIDESLELVHRIMGKEESERVQLGIQYRPDPPFPGGDPETSRPVIVAEEEPGGRRIHDYLAPIIRGLEDAHPAPPPLAAAAPR